MLLKVRRTDAWNTTPVFDQTGNKIEPTEVWVPYEDNPELARKDRFYYVDIDTVAELKEFITRNGHDLIIGYDAGDSRTKDEAYGEFNAVIYDSYLE